MAAAREASRPQLRHMVCQCLSDILDECPYLGVQESLALSKRRRHEERTCSLFKKLRSAEQLLRSLNFSSPFCCLPASVVFECMFKAHKKPFELTKENSLKRKSISNMYDAILPFSLPSWDLSTIVELPVEHERKLKKQRSDNSLIPAKGYRTMLVKYFERARKALREAENATPPSDLLAPRNALLAALRTSAHIRPDLYYEESHRILGLFLSQQMQTKVEVTLSLKNILALPVENIPHAYLLVDLFAEINLSDKPSKLGSSILSLYLVEAHTKRKNLRSDEQDGKQVGEQGGE